MTLLYLSVWTDCVFQVGIAYDIVKTFCFITSNDDRCAQKKKIFKKFCSPKMKAIFTLKITFRLTLVEKIYFIKET